jgi:hypothetical protein
MNELLKTFFSSKDFIFLFEKQSESFDEEVTFLYIYATN